MDFLILIKNGCDNLTTTVAPSIDSLGLHMVLSLATIMLVWFGVQEALASAQGGAGLLQCAKFLEFFLLLTFAYCFVKFYDGSVPGIGYSLKSFISGGTSSLVDYIGSDSTQEVQNTIHAALSKMGTLSPFAHGAVHTALHVYSADRSCRLDGTNRSDHRLRRHRCIHTGRGNQLGQNQQQRRNTLRMLLRRHNRTATNSPRTLRASSRKTQRTRHELAVQRRPINAYFFLL